MTEQHRLEFVGQDLRGTDLRGRDLSDRVLYNTDLRECQLYGSKVSLTCDTFDQVWLDDVQFASLLLMASKAHVSPAWRPGLEALVTQVLGDRVFRHLQAYVRMA